MKISERVRIVLSGLLLAASVLLPLQTVSAGQGFYTINKSIRTGMLVSLTKNPGVVEPANTPNAASLVGVIGSSSNDLSVQAGQVDVQTDGLVKTLVSTLDGDVQVGDQIGTSSIEGFGAKAPAGGWIVGVAQGSLDAHTSGAVRSVVYDSGGGKHTVYTAAVPVLIKVTYVSPPSAADKQSNFIPKIMQDVADTLAGHHASAAAVILSFLLLIGGIGIAAFITNVAIRNGLRGISRQPLSKKSIVRQMTRSVFGAIGLLAASIGGALVIIHVL